MLRLVCAVALFANLINGLDLLGDEMVDLINHTPNMTWVAGRNFAVSLENIYHEKCEFI